MSILQYNGGAVIAMAGKNCVGICSDKRLGMQAQTIAMDFEKVFRVTDKVYTGLTGLASDVITLDQLLKFRTNLYKLRENREIKPEAFSALLSSMLYEKRFSPWFCEPIVAGLKDDNTPFLSGMDLIGAPVFTDDFVVAGTCTSNLHGLCETLYRPDMNADELFEVLSQCLLSSLERDALSGWGAVVHIITPEGVHTRHLKCRQD
jgi:20S proteasome subunit beta 3